MQEYQDELHPDRCWMLAWILVGWAQAWKDSGRSVSVTGLRRPPSRPQSLEAQGSPVQRPQGRPLKWALVCVQMCALGTRFQSTEREYVLRLLEDKGNSHSECQHVRWQRGNAHAYAPVVVAARF